MDINLQENKVTTSYSIISQNLLKIQDLHKI